MEQTFFTYEDTLTVGTYKLRFQSAIIPEEWINTIINTLKGLLGYAIEVFEGKNITILDSKVIEDDSGNKFIEVKFELLQNPVPVAAIVLAVLAVLGIFGAFLTFSSIEKITSEPVIGTGIGLGLILVVAVGFLWLLKNFKTLT